MLRLHKKGHYIKDCQLLKKGNNSNEVSSSKANLVEEKGLVAMAIEEVQCMHIRMITNSTWQHKEDHLSGG